MGIDETKQKYKELGFKCGLEIHQRLSTKHKLFCRCIANAESETAISKIERRQRAVAGELGTIDQASSFESKKQKFFVYNIFRKSSCLVDCDEEPPNLPNLEAVRSAISICKSFNADIPDEIEIMRKGVVDGSDTSAFQRTMMIGYDGNINVGDKTIPITSIFLEEESSGIIKNTDEYVEYGLDRLGIPLIEIDTDPVIETPKEAKQVAMAIGLLLRLTGTAQRGIGSIRQDVNISIKGGARVEIKGFQELETMDEIIDAEIKRQVKLLEIIDELKKRKASVGAGIELTEIFSKTNSKLILSQIKNGGVVIGVKLSGFKGLIGMEIGNDLRLGTEISDYAKSSGVKGIIHSDENLDKYEISELESSKIKERLEMNKDDAFILVAEKREKAEYAVRLAIERAKVAILSVPSETRAADSKRVSTRFLRPMPGRSRMYPETDTLPIDSDDVLKEFVIEKVDVARIKKQLDDEIKNAQLSEQMLWSKDLPLYRKIIKTTGVNPAVVAAILLEKMKELKRNNIDVESINEETITRLFHLYANGRITKGAIGEILSLIPKTPEEIDELIKSRKLGRISGKNLEKIIAENTTSDDGKTIQNIMSKYRLTVDGEELNKILRNKTNKS